MHKCNCEQLPEQTRLILHEEMASHWNHLDAIAVAIKTLAGVTTRLLQRFEESNGMPKGQIFQFSQGSPAQNTKYTSNAVAINGVARGLVIGGPGNVSIYKNNPNEIGGSTLLAIVPSAGVAVPLPFHIKISNGDTFTISTDAAGGTGLLSFCAWVEPVGLAGQDLYQMGI